MFPGQVAMCCSCDRCGSSQHGIVLPFSCRVWMGRWFIWYFELLSFRGILGLGRVFYYNKGDGSVGFAQYWLFYVQKKSSRGGYVGMGGYI